MIISFSELEESPMKLKALRISPLAVGSSIDGAEQAISKSNLSQDDFDF